LRDKRIIIIEDDPDLGWLVQVRLQQAGYHASVAGDGAAGIRLFLSEGADLVLLDIDLPVMNGMEVLARVRKASNVPVVLMTAYLKQLQDLRTMGLDQEHYIAKPFSPKDLVARVECLLSSDAAETAKNHTELLQKATGRTT